MAKEISEESFVNLALCVVGDIRGFTTMQTRVHEFVFETIKHDHQAADDVRDAYKKYVQVSQAKAHEILTESLEGGLLGAKGKVIKATGDGYMIAVDVPRDEKLFAECIGEMSNLIASAYRLAEESDLSSNGFFGKLTRRFLKTFGYQIGINIADVKKEMEHRRPCHKAVQHNSRFRIAVGVSMGFTTFFRQSHDRRIQDVSGYGVNLAFRLCDQAGRGYDPEDKRCTPAVLLDRRVGNALLKYPESPFRVLPWNEPLKMKGFEEAWAYYLAPRRKPSAR